MTADRPEHESLTFEQLVATALADGTDAVVKLLRPLPPSRVREVLADEVGRRAAQLLDQARGDPVRAWDKLMVDRDHAPTR